MRKEAIYTGIGAAALIAAIAAFYLIATKPSREANQVQRLSGNEISKESFLGMEEAKRRNVWEFIEKNKGYLEDRFLDPEQGSDPNKGAYAYLDKNGNVVYYCWDGLYAKPVEKTAREGDRGSLDLMGGSLLDKVSHNSLKEAFDYLNGRGPSRVGNKYLAFSEVEPPNTKGLRMVIARLLHYQEAVRDQMRGLLE